MERTRFFRRPVVWIILVIAAAAFAVVGIPPLAGLTKAAHGQISSGATLLDLARSFGALVLRAPVAFHVVVLTAFVSINVVLFLLLRRPPRGIDV